MAEIIILLLPVQQVKKENKLQNNRAIKLVTKNGTLNWHQVTMNIIFQHFCSHQHWQQWRISGAVGTQPFWAPEQGVCICKITYSYSLLKPGIHRFLYGLVQCCNLVLKFEVIFFKLEMVKEKKIIYRAAFISNKVVSLKFWRNLLHLPSTCVQHWFKENRDNTSNKGIYILSKANKK